MESSTQRVLIILVTGTIGGFIGALMFLLVVLIITKVIDMEAHTRKIIITIVAVAVIGMAVLLLTGCADPSYLLQRAMLNADCRPGHLQPDGQCTPLTK